MGLLNSKISRDYKYKGEELASTNFLDFMLDTYEVSKETNGEDMWSVENGMDEVPKCRGRGQPSSMQISYQDEAGKGKCCQVRRSQKLETLPRFVGTWLCRSDNECKMDLFRANMLMLLKPWIVIGTGRQNPPGCRVRVIRVRVRVGIYQPW
jgi:hypothetical protein